MGIVKRKQIKRMTYLVMQRRLRALAPDGRLKYILNRRLDHHLGDLEWGIEYPLLDSLLTLKTDKGT